MNIETKYEIGQKVHIDQLNKSGIIMSIYYLNKVEYCVRYFVNGDIRNPHFFEDELRAIEEKTVAMTRAKLDAEHEVLKALLEGEQGG